jgi:fibro-slime domain-containing protein
MRYMHLITGGALVAAVGLAGALLIWPSQTMAYPPTGGQTLGLWGRVRDFQPTPAHPDFNVTPSNGYGPYCGNIATTLDADGKPVFNGNGWRVQQQWRDSSNRLISWCMYNAALGDHPGHAGAYDHGAITSQASFAQWYRDVPGVNMSRLWRLNLTWMNDPRFGWCYGWDTNDFNPIDNQLFGNGHGNQHNFYFTYEIQCQFTYDAAGHQFMNFKGDDDCWVFVNNHLAIDHGGIAGSRDQYVDMDRFGLVNGQEYTLSFFQAERHQPQGQFHLRTNIVTLHSVGTDAVLSAYD